MSLATLKIGAVACLSVGGILSVFSAFIPGMEQDNLESTAEENAFLTPSNQAKWDTVPGQYNYEVYWNHYLFSNANPKEVSPYYPLTLHRPSTKTQSLRSRRWVHTYTKSRTRTLT